MIIIAEANMLPGLTEADKKVLLGMSAQDKVIVLSDKKSSVPIETMQLFMGMKAKTDFIQLDDLKMGFGLGYRYGKFSETYTKDKVKILTNNDYSAIVSSNMICVKSLSAAAKKGSSVKKTTNKTEAVNKPQTPAKTKKVEATKTPSGKEVTEEKKTTTRRPRLKDLSAGSMIATYPDLAPFKGKLETLNGMFIDAIKKSSDPNISFKMQLQMIFADDTEKVWKIIKKDFTKLKALAEN